MVKQGHATVLHHHDSFDLTITTYEGMSMKKSNWAVSTMGSVALILSGAAVADPPAAFDVWTAVNTGSGATVTFGDYDSGTAGTQTCPAGYTCGTPVTGSGFLQRQLTDSSGNQYFQTIVIPETSGSAGGDAPSSLSFADESFVRVGVDGMSGQQRAVDSTTTSGVTTTFSTATIVNSGWASGGSTYKDLDVSQAITVNDGSQDTLYNAFTLQMNGPSTSPTGKFISVEQGVMIEAGSNTGSNADDDMQKFVMKEAVGDLNSAAHTLGSPVLLPNSTTGTDVAWSGTDDVKVIWVGQQMVKSGVDSFRYQFYDNITSAADDSISDFEVGQSDPWTWVNPFGSTPTMSVP
ncbi:MAG TPA: hypothetical protein ENJ19_02855 [Gammaproteobacteria bacterium]|nr:hypothetical protein [Gammaproteobacteria bacterium]